MRRTWLCFIIYEIIKSGTINDHVNVQVNDHVNVQVNDQVNVLNIATLFGVSGKTIRRDLYVMRDMNLIHYVGSDKTGHWEVKHGKIHMHQS
ncbi:DeoR family transcriptional regulator [Prevotellamassilia timonensis]|uniref:DeoR family transcriptional regulator n=1 Tax=Prevotellamassilia timonensis TaxID=1852370 RepID=UPI003C6DEF9C